MRFNPIDSSSVRSAPILGAAAPKAKKPNKHLSRKDKALPPTSSPAFSAVPDAILAVMLDETAPTRIAEVRAAFGAHLQEHGITDWRAAWRTWTVPKDQPSPLDLFEPVFA